MASPPDPSSRQSGPASSMERHVSISPEPTIIPSTSTSPERPPRPPSRQTNPASIKERHVSISPDPTIIPSTSVSPERPPRPSLVIDDSTDSNEKLKGPFLPPNSAEDLEKQLNDKDSVGADLAIVASKRAKQFGHDAKMCVLEIVVVAFLVVSIAIGVRFGFRSTNPNPDQS